MSIQVYISHKSPHKGKEGNFLYAPTMDVVPRVDDYIDVLDMGTFKVRKVTWRANKANSAIWEAYIEIRKPFSSEQF